MPTGGQISAGSGLALQSTTPGTKDTGNANISGRFIAQNGILPINTFPTGGANVPILATDPIVVGDNPILSGGNVNGNSSGLNSIFIGRGNTFQQNLNGNGQFNNVVIGSALVVKGGNGTTIGQSCTNGNANAYPGRTLSSNTVIGYTCVSTFQTTSPVLDGSTVIGQNSGDSAGASVILNGSICIGMTATSTNVNGNNIVIGKNELSSGTNNILLGLGATIATDNTIKIGDPTHGDVSIGPVILAPKPAITGSRASGAALADLLTKLAAANLITDSTTI